MISQVLARVVRSRIESDPTTVSKVEWNLEKPFKQQETLMDYDNANDLLNDYMFNFRFD